MMFDYKTGWKKVEVLKEEYAHVDGRLGRIKKVNSEERREGTTTNNSKRHLLARRRTRPLTEEYQEKEEAD